MPPAGVCRGFGYPLYPESPGRALEKGDRMSEVRHSVTLHPETVSKGESLARERRERSRVPRDPEPEVTRRYRKRPPWMNPLVWNEAVRLAGGDTKRVILNSPTEALVVNR